ncbi:MAG: CoA-transferase [Bacillota bacterium]|nr:CoA-transferase [Bacillota bacterium]
MTGLNKIKSISEAVAIVPDGAHLALSGFTIARNATAGAHELIRQNKKDLTLSQCIGGMDVDLLVGAGLVKRYIYGGGSLDRFGPLLNINRAIEQATIEVDEFSGLSMAMRFMGGSLGLPCIPIQSLLGSDLLESLLKKEKPEVKVTECPFSREKMVLLKTLQPDFAFIHVQKADCEGNAIINGPRWDEDAAKAADKIVIIADEIIPTELTPYLVEEVRIPACRVDIVVHQPYGAHPTSLYGSYDYDYDHLTEYVASARTEQGMDEYLDRYVRETGNFSAYLEKVGGLNKMISLKADPLKKY